MTSIFERPGIYARDGENTLNRLQLNFKTRDVTTPDDLAGVPFPGSDIHRQYMVEIRVAHYTRCAPRDWPRAKEYAVKALGYAMYEGVQSAINQIREAVFARDGERVLEIIDNLARTHGPEGAWEAFRSTHSD